MAKHPSRKVINFKHLLGYDTIVVREGSLAGFSNIRRVANFHAVGM